MTLLKGMVIVVSCLTSDSRYSLLLVFGRCSILLYIRDGSRLVASASFAVEAGVSFFESGGYRSVLKTDESESFCASSLVTCIVVFCSYSFSYLRLSSRLFRCASISVFCC